jgi:hypothetical protein
MQVIERAQEKWRFYPFVVVAFCKKEKVSGECFLNCVTQRRYARNVLIINALRS